MWIHTWLLDQLKSLLLSLVLGLVLGSGMLWLVGWLGNWWWLPAWVLFTLFQLLITVIAPVWILPLFNKFEPLQDETLREGILDLARKAGFPVSGVFQIDASLRSTHSNAYFFGFGKTRRIALYDTLIEQHTHKEILSVMAHEIGHWVKKHVVKMMAASVILTGIGMAIVARLLDVRWLYEMIGTANSYASIGVTGPVASGGLYVVGILLSPVSLILSPITNGYSRHNEYKADAYSLELYPHPSALEEGLIRLSEKNLSNLFPHPLVVFFQYSHPPLLQRVEAIRRQTGTTWRAICSTGAKGGLFSIRPSQKPREGGKYAQTGTIFPMGRHSTVSGMGALTGSKNTRCDGPTSQGRDQALVPAVAAGRTGYGSTGREHTGQDA